MNCIVPVGAGLQFQTDVLFDVYIYMFLHTNFTYFRHQDNSL